MVPMRVRVRLFAMQRELAGTREVSLDLANGSTIEDAWTAIVGRFPVLAPGRTSLRFARNGEYADAAAELTGPWALFLWLRLLVGLVFPLVVSWAAVQTARTRSMESATGLLYINVGTIAAGTILAAGLYFGAGILA